MAVEVAGNIDGGGHEQGGQHEQRTVAPLLQRERRGAPASHAEHSTALPSTKIGTESEEPIRALRPARLVAEPAVMSSSTSVSPLSSASTPSIASSGATSEPAASLSPADATNRQVPASRRPSHAASSATTWLAAPTDPGQLVGRARGGDPPHHQPQARVVAATSPLWSRPV